MSKTKSQIAQTRPGKYAWDSAKYSRIRGASAALYGALEKACTKHTEHLVHLCLDEKPATSSQILFRLSFTHLTLSLSDSPVRTTWFLVESVVTDRKKDLTTETNNTMANLTKTLKRERTPPRESLQKKAKKSVRFRSPTPPLPSCQAPSLSVVQPSAALTQLCQRSNFCDQMRACLQQRASTSVSCLGILDRSGSWEQRVYTT